MVTKEEFGHFISEFESFRDFVLEEIEKLKTEIERVNEDLKELKKDLSFSGKINYSKKIN